MARRRIVDVRLSEGSHVIDPKGDVYHVGVDKTARAKDGAPASYLTYLGNVIDDLREMLGPKRKARR